MVAIEVPEVEYTDYTNRQLVAIPLAVLAVALLILGGWYLATGAPADLGVEFTGGAELRLSASETSDLEMGTPEARAALEDPDTFSIEPSSIQYAPGDETYIVTFRPEDLPEDAGSGDFGDIAGEAEAAGFAVTGEDIVSASFGSGVQTQALGGVVIAFLGMSVLVFAMFRTFVPSIAVVASAFSDIIIPVAVMNLLGIDMTLGTVAALLMIIGYSVDSDILLNNSVLRRTGGFYESVQRAMRTGVTMTITSIAAMIVMTIVAWVFGIDLLRDIGVILAVGLCADLMNTYLLNVSLLRWYSFEGVSR
ncbi:protein translocase subunit secF [Halopenitus malekzadehii]|uniref:Protein-export membrane protein SecF n=1 Tax=Halopenitus malekzadehii TaxID=1267564 RepID=A0A1H6JBI9_9EURY|nr:protein translocase subunit SecF [Halopenitus malekzadehii]SEH56994.1 protein translocase subunit secF [Halopenitus malekzadehii]